MIMFLTSKPRKITAGRFQFQSNIACVFDEGFIPNPSSNLRLSNSIGTETCRR